MVKETKQKRELKIIFGVLLTIATLSIIVAIIVLAVDSAKTGSQLFFNKYDYIEPVMRDGVFIAVRDGEYVLVREDRIISRRHSALTFLEDTQTYAFVTLDGFTGELDNEGRELYRRRIVANEISLFNRSGTPFYFAEEGGVQAVYFAQRTAFENADKIYTFAELNRADLLTLPLGVVLYRDRQSGENLISSVQARQAALTQSAPAPAFLLSASVVNGPFLTVSDGDYKTYSLPNLTHIPFLDGARSNEIFNANGTPVRYAFEGGKHMVRFESGGTVREYETSGEPSDVHAVSNSSVLVVYQYRDAAKTDPETVALHTPDTVWEGRYSVLTHQLFFIGDTLFSTAFARITETQSGASEARVLHADGVQYVFIDDAVYTFNGTQLSLRLGAASGLGGVTYKIFQGKMFFVYNNRFYNNTFRQLFGGENVSFDSDPARNNLVRVEEGRYVDFSGRPVSNVRNVFDVYDFAGARIEGEYIFETAAGAYQSFLGTVSSSVSGIVENVYKSERGGFVFKTNVGFTAGGILLRGAELFGDSGIAVADGQSITTYIVTANNEFSLTQTHFYSTITSTFSPFGIVIEDANGLQGFYDRDGRRVFGPTYLHITLTENFVFARMPSRSTASTGLIRVYNHAGRSVTNLQVTEIEGLREYGGYIVVRTTDGRSRLLAWNGTVVAEYAEHWGTFESLVTDTGDRSDAQAPRLLEIPDTEFTYEIFVVQDGMQILRIAN
ncbi:MAG: hypothetical protein FWH03_01420 [Firmicutes bacterium]|nr:hypothetical protein [Bacillota bacterium]